MSVCVDLLGLCSDDGDSTQVSIIFPTPWFWLHFIMFGVLMISEMLVQYSFVFTSVSRMALLLVGKFPR